MPNIRQICLVYCSFWCLKKREKEQLRNEKWRSIFVNVYNSLWPSDSVWWHWPGSTLAQVMAWLSEPMLPSINQVLWHSPEGNFTGNTQDIYPWYELKMTNLNLQVHLPGSNELKAWEMKVDICVHNTCIYVVIVHVTLVAKAWTTILAPYLNSLWPSDTIWHQGSGSTLAQVMACCLTAPSHYLNQCWLIISEVQWHSSEGNFIKDVSTINH